MTDFFFDDEFKRKLQFIYDWIRSLNGPGIVPGPGGPSFFSVPPRRSPPPPIPTPLVRALVTGFASPIALGGGKYWGKKLTGATTVAANSTDLALPEGLTPAAAVDCMIVNMAESGSSAHSLTDADNASPYVMGFVDGSVTVLGTTYDVLWVDAVRLFQGCS